MSEPCDHGRIVTFRGDGVVAWACEDCRLRFYPACRTCVDVGHRNVVHLAAEPDDGLRAAPRKGTWAAHGYEPVSATDERCRWTTPNPLGVHCKAYPGDACHVSLAALDAKP